MPSISAFLPTQTQYFGKVSVPASRTNLLFYTVATILLILSTCNWRQRSVAISGTYQLIGINKTSDDLVMIFHVAGPVASYCSWYLEDLKLYSGLFYDTKDRTSGNCGDVLSLTESRTEWNLHLHRSATCNKKNPTLSNSYCNCKKLHLLHLLSLQKDSDN